MKKKISKLLFVMIFVLSGTWPPGTRGPIGKQIHVPGQPPIIVVFPGGGK